MAFEHQKVAISLLLCSPTELSRAWTNNEDSTLTAAKAELAKLPFTSEASLAAVKFMQDAFQFRPFFKGIADSLKAQFYAGAEPHPGGGMATNIVNALKQLDQGSASGSKPAEHK